MQLRFKKDAAKSKVWIEIPGIMVKNENLKIQISQCTSNEINLVTAQSYTKVQGRRGTTQYLDNPRLISNIADMVASHMHGWNLLDEKDQPVECTLENAKIFLDIWGNTDIENPKKKEEYETITLQAFIGNQVQDPAIFLNGDSKNLKTS